MSFRRIFTDMRTLWWALILGACGSFYSLLNHVAVRDFGLAGQICNVGGKFNCDSVVLSPYSEWFGVPLGVFGLAYFFAGSVLAARVALGRELLPFPAILWAVSGATVSLFLFSVSLFKIGALCLACTLVHLSSLTCFGWFFSQTPIRAIHWNGFQGGWWRRQLIGLAAMSSVALVTGVSAHLVRRPVTARAIAAFNLRSGSEITRGHDAAEMFADFMKQPLVDPLSSGLDPSALADPSFGAEKPLVTLVAFLDYTCAACTQFKKTLADIVNREPGQVRVVLRHLPLDGNCFEGAPKDFHKNACRVARAGICAARAGRFWAFYGISSSLSGADPVRDIAVQINLEPKEFKVCVDDGEITARLGRDTADASKLGLSDTPALFINGRRYLGALDSNSIWSILAGLLKGKNESSEIKSANR
jgi:uncharacterized membrane protein/protein-disulfide isomerase